LSEALVPGAWIELDLSAVVTADFSFVQLIEAARCHADTVGARLALRTSARTSARPDAPCRSCGQQPYLLDRWRHNRMSAQILTVDDSASVRMAIRIALSGAGYSVAEAGNGLEALAKLQAGHFDMVVTDLNMPQMDGLTMIRELRKMPGQTGIPSSSSPPKAMTA
jgi:PleD family two-component response regulator